MEDYAYWDIKPEILLGIEMPLDYIGSMSINNTEKYAFVALPSAEEDMTRLATAIRERLPNFDWTQADNVNGARTSCNMRHERGSIQWDLVREGDEVTFSVKGVGLRVSHNPYLLNLDFLVFNCF